MINLLAKLGLDISPLKRGLAQAVDTSKVAGAKMGERMGATFTKGIGKYLGAGAVVGGTVGLFRDAQRIRDESNAAHVSMQKQMAIERVLSRIGDTANVSAVEISRLADEEIALGNVTGEATLNKLADAGAQVESRWTKAKRAVANILPLLLKLDSFLITSRWNNDVARGKPISERANRTPILTSASRGSFFREGNIEGGWAKPTKYRKDPLLLEAGGLTSMGLGAGVGALSPIRIQEAMLREQQKTTQEIKKVVIKVDDVAKALK